MAARLKLDTVALRDAGTSLRVVAQEFNDANANSDGVARRPVSRVGVSPSSKVKLACWYTAESCSDGACARWSR